MNEHGSALIYRDARLYGLAMRVLEGRGGDERRRLIAGEVPPGSTVADLCCGDAAIAPLLVARGCRYTGYDVSDAFVRSGRRRGLDVRLWDANTMDVPGADVVCMLSSLYQFIPRDRDLLERMLAAAGQRVIVSEPIRNWASSRSRLLRWAAGRMTRVDGRVFEERHTRESIEDLASAVPADARRLLVTPREAILVVETARL